MMRRGIELLDAAFFVGQAQARQAGLLRRAGIRARLGSFLVDMRGLVNSHLSLTAVPIATTEALHKDVVGMEAAVLVAVSANRDIFAGLYTEDAAFCFPCHSEVGLGRL